MSEFRFIPAFISGSAENADGSWLPGLPHVLVALSSGLVFGWVAGVVGLLMAAFVSFVLYLPLIALALHGGRPIPLNAPPPAMPPLAHGVLLGLWTLTAWTVAWAA